MEILNTTNEMKNVAEMLLMFGVIGFMLGGFYTMVAFYDSNSTFHKVCSSLIVMVCVIFIAVSIFLPDETIHEVIINDIDKFNYEKYEITEQNGKIFTVIEVGD